MARELVIYEVRERFIKAFLDLLILALVKDQPRCGYDILATIHREFNILISPGTLYPLLHMLEENELIESTLFQRKRNYFISKKGLEIFKRSSIDFKRSEQTLLSITAAQ